MPEYIESRDKNKMLESASSSIKGKIRAKTSAIEELLAEKETVYSKGKKGVYDKQINRLQKTISTLDFILTLIEKERGDCICVE